MRVLLELLLAQLEDQQVGQLLISDVYRGDVLSFEVVVLSVVHVVRVVILLSVLFVVLDFLGLELVKQHHVVVEHYVPAPREEVHENVLFVVSLHSELLVHLSLIYQLKLLVLQWVILLEVDKERHLVSIISQVDEAIVEEKATVALLAIAIINLISTWNVLQGLDDEAVPHVTIGPLSLARSSVV